MTRRWGRGMLRLWVLATVIWIVIASLFLLGGPFFDEMLHPERYPGSDAVEGWSLLAGTWFGPPIIILLLGAAIAWVLRGFRSENRTVKYQTDEWIILAEEGQAEEQRQPPEQVAHPIKKGRAGMKRNLLWLGAFVLVTVAIVLSGSHAAVSV